MYCFIFLYLSTWLPYHHHLSLLAQFQPFCISLLLLHPFMFCDSVPPFSIYTAMVDLQKQCEHTGGSGCVGNHAQKSIFIKPTFSTSPH
ncbi:hypothetical protein XENTR_v10001631 [Xenopus tropicalis]|nr:hypothetical protein XENTR_v10001631 [Xenopus tropicalis]